MSGGTGVGRGSGSSSVHITVQPSASSVDSFGDFAYANASDATTDTKHNAASKSTATAAATTATPRPVQRSELPLAHVRWDRLNDDGVFAVLRFVAFEQLLTVAVVCKRWARIAALPVLWAPSAYWHWHVIGADLPRMFPTHFPAQPPHARDFADVHEDLCEWLIERIASAGFAQCYTDHLLLREQNKRKAAPAMTAAKPAPPATTVPNAVSAVPLQELSVSSVSRADQPPAAAAVAVASPAAAAPSPAAATPAAASATTPESAASAPKVLKPTKSAWLELRREFVKYTHGVVRRRLAVISERLAIRTHGEQYLSQQYVHHWGMIAAGVIGYVLLLAFLILLTLHVDGVAIPGGWPAVCVPLLLFGAAQAAFSLTSFVVQVWVAPFHMYRVNDPNVRWERTCMLGQIHCTRIWQVLMAAAVVFLPLVIAWYDAWGVPGWVAPLPLGVLMLWLAVCGVVQWARDVHYYGRCAYMHVVLGLSNIRDKYLAVISAGLTPVIAFIVLVILRVSGVVAWPWAAVFTPMWFMHAAALAITAFTYRAGRMSGTFAAILVGWLVAPQIAFQVLLCLYLEGAVVHFWSVALPLFIVYGATPCVGKWILSEDWRY